MPLIHNMLLLGSVAGANVEYIAAGSNYGLHIFKFDPNTNSLTQTATYNLQDQSISETAPVAGSWAANNKIFFMATRSSSNTRVTSFRFNAGSLTYYDTDVTYDSVGTYGVAAATGGTNWVVWSRGGGGTGNISNTIWTVAISNTNPVISLEGEHVVPIFPKMLSLGSDRKYIWANNNYFNADAPPSNTPTASNNFGSMEDTYLATAHRGIVDTNDDIIAAIYAGGIYAIKLNNRTDIDRINSFTFSPENPYSLDMSKDCQFIAAGNTSSLLEIIRHIESNGNLTRVMNMQFKSYMNVNTDIQSVRYNDVYANSGNLRLYVSDYTTGGTTSGNHHSNLIVISCNSTGHGTVLATYNLRDTTAFKTYTLSKIYDIIESPP